MNHTKMMNGIKACLAGIGLLALSGCGAKPAIEAVKAETTIPVQVYAIQPAMVTASEQYTAEIKADRQVDLSYRVSGQVNALHQVRGRSVQAGDFVAQGTVLARLRGTEFQAQVNKARAQLQENEAARAGAQATLAKAEAALEQARLYEERAQRLYRADGLTKPDLDQARTQLDVARAEATAARAGISLAQAQAGAAQAQIVESETTARDAALVAPFAGVVVQRNLELGSSAGPGGAIPHFVLADIQRVKAVFHVPDITLQRLKPGSRLSLRTAALGDRELTGQVSSIAPTADAATRLFAIEVTLGNPQSLLRPGMMATIQLANEAPQQVLTVPASAIARTADDSQAYRVFVIEESNGKTYARLRRIILGPANGDSLIIASGLSPGERVIIGGNNTVRADAEVRIVP